MPAIPKVMAVSVGWTDGVLLHSIPPPLVGGGPVPVEPGGTPPVVLDVTVPADGSGFVVMFDQAVMGLVGFDFQTTSGTGTVAIGTIGGEGTDTYTFPGTRTIRDGETFTFSYTAGDIVGDTTSLPLADIAGGTVTNDSTSVATGSQTYNSGTGTFTVPAGVPVVKATVHGGAGAGGGFDAFLGGGGGGGGGGCAAATIGAALYGPGRTLDYTVAGQATGVLGGDGNHGDPSVVNGPFGGAWVEGSGGVGGHLGTGTGGVGGVGGSTDIHGGAVVVTANDGSTGNNGSAGVGGAGGVGGAPSGGVGGSARTTAATGNGNDGNARGGGGGGALGGAVPLTGGLGGEGRVLFEWPP